MGQVPADCGYLCRLACRLSGDLTSIFIDYETFGEHFWKETGILNFLSYLPPELEKRGVRTTLPTEALDNYPPVGTIDVRDTISWADIEKDASAWMGNERQHTAYSAIQKAAAFAKDKAIWRYLQTSDHFYYMASKFGTCGEVHNYFSHHEAEDAFRTYMAILADFENRNIRFMKNKQSAKTLRTLTPEEAFHFSSPSGYVGYAAYSLDAVLRPAPGGAGRLDRLPPGTRGYRALDRTYAARSETGRRHHWPHRPAGTDHPD